MDEARRSYEAALKIEPTSTSALARINSGTPPHPADCPGRRARRDGR
ncbi:hypothetical protein [Stenotrophomonas maltophilia]|nr:hypothetical protein [Stenotrophomonas maltophilia]